MDNPNATPGFESAPPNNIPASSPAPAPAPKKSNTGLIIAIIVVVLCCCCLLVVAVGWIYGDQILQQLQQQGYGSGMLPVLASFI